MDTMLTEQDTKSTTKTMENKIHVFELAGLGKPPYSLVNMHQRGGTCMFCSRGLFNVFVLTSSDNKIFSVGCECIKKSNDRGLTTIVKEHERKKRRAKNEKLREAKRLLEIEQDAKTLAYIKSEFNRIKLELKKQPHFNEYFASQGKTLTDYIEYMTKENPNNCSCANLRKWTRRIIGLLCCNGANFNDYTFKRGKLVKDKN